MIETKGNTQINNDSRRTIEQFEKVRAGYLEARQKLGNDRAVDSTIQLPKIGKLHEA